MRILWIDDEIEQLKDFVELLTYEGFEVDTADDPQEALRKLSQGTYDFVLLDYRMPTMDGISVLKAIKLMNPNIPVVMLTMMTDKDVIEEAIGNDVFDYLIKPIKPAHILTIASKIRKHEIRRKFAGIGIMETYQIVNSIVESYEGWIERARILFEKRVSLSKSERETIDMEIHSQNERFSKWIRENYSKLLESKTFSHNVLSRLILPKLEEGKVAVFLFDAFRMDQFIMLLKDAPRHFRTSFEFYMALLPTSTMFCRNSFFAGKLPLEIHRRYPSYLENNLHEIELFDEFLRENHLSYTYRIHKINEVEELSKLKPSKADIEIVVINFTDSLLHAKTNVKTLKDVSDVDVIIGFIDGVLKEANVYESMQIYLNEGYTLLLTTDHGWIVAKQPIPIMGGSELTEALRYKFGDSVRFLSRKGILVKELESWGLPPYAERLAIADVYGYLIYKTNEREYKAHYRNFTVHGGISLEEMILPLIKVF